MGKLIVNCMAVGFLGMIALITSPIWVTGLMVARVIKEISEDA